MSRRGSAVEVELEKLLVRRDWRSERRRDSRLSAAERRDWRVLSWVLWDAWRVAIVWAFVLRLELMFWVCGPGGEGGGLGC